MKSYMRLTGIKRMKVRGRVRRVARIRRSVLIAAESDPLAASAQTVTTMNVTRARGSGVLSPLIADPKTSISSAGQLEAER